MIYINLFIAFFKIGILGFGGGYAMLSLIQNQVVTQHKWITDTEFTNIVAISQMTPGPISINSATYIGYTVTGSVWGSVLTTLGVCLPSLILMIVASIFFAKMKDNKYIKQVMRNMRPIVIALILAAAIPLMTKENFIDYKSYIIFGVSLLLLLKKVNPILVMITSGIAGLILF